MAGISEEDEYNWTFMSDKQKGLIEAFKTSLPRVAHRFCVRHLHENFKRVGFKGHIFKTLLWSAATSIIVQYFKEARETMKKVDGDGHDWFDDKDAAQWSRAYFTTAAKCDILLNKMCEVFNSFILDARDKPIRSKMSMLKDLVMVRMTMNRDKILCPKPREKLIKNVKDASCCLPMKCDRTHFQVFTISTANQYVVDLEKNQISCRRWQLNGIPCKHACAIRFNGDHVEDFVDDWYIVTTYKKVYAHAIKPMVGPELWPQT